MDVMFKKAADFRNAERIQLNTIRARTKDAAENTTTKAGLAIGLLCLVGYFAMEVVQSFELEGELSSLSVRAQLVIVLILVISSLALLCRSAPDAGLRRALKVHQLTAPTLALIAKRLRTPGDADNYREDVWAKPIAPERATELVEAASSELKRELIREKRGFFGRQLEVLRRPEVAIQRRLVRHVTKVLISEIHGAGDVQLLVLIDSLTVDQKVLKRAPWGSWSAVPIMVITVLAMHGVLIFAAAPLV